MVRVYSRKTDRGEKWIDDNMQKALQEKNNKEIKIRKAGCSTAFHKEQYFQEYKEGLTNTGRCKPVRN